MLHVAFEIYMQKILMFLTIGFIYFKQNRRPPPWSFPADHDMFCGVFRLTRCSWVHLCFLWTQTERMRRKFPTESVWGVFQGTADSSVQPGVFGRVNKSSWMKYLMAIVTNHQQRQNSKDKLSHASSHIRSIFFPEKISILAL